MSSKRIREKQKDVTEAIKRGEAKAYTDADGRRTVKKVAPNTDKRTVRRSILGTRIFYNCPKCGKPLEYKKKMHQGLCMRCGQRLDWADVDEMPCVILMIHDADEAGYWAGQYELTCGTLYGIDYDEWRLSMVKKQYPMQLYFPFTDKKAYGRFMREASREGTVVT